MALGHSVRMVELPKDRLRKAMERAGHTKPTDAWRALKRLLPGKDLFISNLNGNRAISRQAAAKYGEAFGVEPGWILFGDEGEGSAPAYVPVFSDVPLVSWISAGELQDQETVMDFSDFPHVSAVDLPEGDWLALRVENNSMNKISPPDSVIFVNRRDKRLVANACYIIADEQGRATYKRYRPNAKPQFQPVSYDKVPAPKLEGAITVIGRVKRSIIDM